mmetsp:Transcript_19511/g.30676  ORF Transcript_19511/g.30676 Transcript_19511/m.30676 type:complete len:90 (-) Transcript_19511:893-1162(-)
MYPEDAVKNVQEQASDGHTFEENDWAEQRNRSRAQINLLPTNTMRIYTDARALTCICIRRITTKRTTSDMEDGILGCIVTDRTSELRVR